jgi:hypothetical protein
MVEALASAVGEELPIVEVWGECDWVRVTGGFGDDGGRAVFQTAAVLVGEPGVLAHPRLLAVTPSAWGGGECGGRGIWCARAGRATGRELRLTLAGASGSWAWGRGGCVWFWGGCG